MMAIKLKKLLLVVLLFFSAFVFGVKYDIIDGKSDEYHRISSCFPHLVSKDAVVLRVSFNNMLDNARFLSGNNKPQMGDICPTSLFSEETFAEEAAKLFMCSRDFPIDLFNFVIVLKEGATLAESTKFRKIAALEAQLVNLERQLEQMEKTHGDTTHSLDSLIDKSATEHDFYKGLKVYLRSWNTVNYWKHAKEAALTAKEQAYATKQKEIDHYSLKIRKLEDSMQAKKIGVYVKEHESKTIDEDILKLKMEHFCAVRGRHAEDALIIRILQNLTKFGKIPKKIEIYGTKDPCFQCQIKLQWLARILADEIQIARKKSGLLPLPKMPKKLEVCYYATEVFEGECLCIDIQAGEKQFATRAEGDAEKLIKFTFGSDDHGLIPAIFDVWKK